MVLDARPDVIWKAKVKKVDPFPKSKHPEVPTQYFGALLAIEGNSGGVKPGQRLQGDHRARRAAAARWRCPARRSSATTAAPSSTGARRWGSDFERVPVTLGPGTVGRVVVLEGLAAGDRIALRDPSRSADELSAPAAAGRRGGAGGAPPAERSRRGPGL